VIKILLQQYFSGKTAKPQTFYAIRIIFSLGEELQPFNPELPPKNFFFIFFFPKNDFLCTQLTTGNLLNE